MPRLRRLVPSGKVFFVTTNLKQGLASFASEERDLLCQAVGEARERRRFRLAGFVVMPDHVHLLILPNPEDTISAVMQDVKQTAARAINRRRGARGTLWQKGFFDRFMRTAKELVETLEYMHQNPVRKNLVAAPEEWKWSSARTYGGLETVLPVDFVDLPAESEKPFR